MKNKSLFQKILISLGIACLSASALIVVMTSAGRSAASADCEKAVAFIESIIPELTVGIKEERSNPGMPSVTYDGEDYAALLSVPRFSVKLPVRSEWDRNTVNKVPCRFTGNPFDGSLIIGGVDSEGQFDFVPGIDIGDAVTVTDMRGRVFHYTVATVKHAKNSKAQTLTDENYDLTLFAKDGKTGDWLLVRCVIQ